MTGHALDLLRRTRTTRCLACGNLDVLTEPAARTLAELTNVRAMPCPRGQQWHALPATHQHAAEATAADR